MNWAIVAAGAAAIGWIATHHQLRQSQAEHAQAKARLAALETQAASLRHDLRGILSPALLTADRLLDNPDPSVRRAGEVMVRTVERTTARLAEKKAVLF